MHFIVKIRADFIGYHLNNEFLLTESTQGSYARKPDFILSHYS
ncbi:hypothetical protein BDGGKGIB_03317 [Nodularia sphaerocarpa UHCC 0038]|nr:hypothetical protein BDGGKGIB_03317 [Nodularia sphaerocarpa UHCC 0038]